MRPGRLIDRALAAAPAQGSLNDVKHVVILMQENRSFDHYFGTMSGVRGFGDPASYGSYAWGPVTDPGRVFRQTTVDGSGPLLTVGGENWLSPFELTSDPPSVAGQTTSDITHEWGAQHLSWNNGAMDRFVVQHLRADGMAASEISRRAEGAAGVPEPGSSEVPIGILTMGYYRQRDSLAFYRAVAQAFTICDGYHCSVLGPTDPNRLMGMSGSIGAHPGDQGGPVIATYIHRRPQMYGTLRWPTMPELLTAHGVSWKVYQDPKSRALFNVLPYFRTFFSPSDATDARNAALGLAPVYPAEFAADVAAGTLPQVSWILPPPACCEHPATPPEHGEYLVSQILETLVGNPEVWAQTVFLVVYDENGGFFDHLAPPTPGPLVTATNGLARPAGSAFDGEYLQSPAPSNAAGGPPDDWDSVLGPVGLGFRVPALVISPFSAGGWVCGDTFDHISTFKLIEKIFLRPGSLLDDESGLHVSAWRYGLVGDLTTALPVVETPAAAVPALPATSLAYPEAAAEKALAHALAGTPGGARAYPVPEANRPVPAQSEPGPGRMCPTTD